MLPDAQFNLQSRLFIATHSLWMTDWLDNTANLLPPLLLLLLLLGLARFSLCCSVSIRSLFKYFFVSVRCQSGWLLGRYTKLNSRSDNSSLRALLAAIVLHQSVLQHWWCGQWEESRRCHLICALLLFPFLSFFCRFLPTPSLSALSLSLFLCEEKCLLAAGNLLSPLLFYLLQFSVCHLCATTTTTPNCHLYISISLTRSLSLLSLLFLDQQQQQHSIRPLLITDCSFATAQ